MANVCCSFYSFSKKKGSFLKKQKQKKISQITWNISEFHSVAVSKRDSLPILRLLWWKLWWSPFDHICTMTVSRSYQNEVSMSTSFKVAAWTDILKTLPSQIMPKGQNKFSISKEENDILICLLVFFVNTMFFVTWLW